MKRRDFITLLGGAAATWPLAARAQQGERMRRVGVLMANSATQTDPEAQARVAAFLDTLLRLGWASGRNIRIDYRWLAGKADPAAAAELVGSTPDVIVAQGNPAASPCRRIVLRWLTKRPLVCTITTCAPALAMTCDPMRAQAHRTD